jgi:hypothetical protein
MSGNIRFGLIIQASTGSDDHPAFVAATVQVWRGDDHVETIRLLDFERTDLPGEIDAMVMENWATAVARVAARKLADAQMAAVDAENLHIRAQYAEVPDAGA